MINEILDVCLADLDQEDIFGYNKNRLIYFEG